MTVDKETLRTAFERWYSEDGRYPKAVERDPNGQYVLISAGNAWDVWCAAFDSLGEPFAYFQRNIGWDSWEQVIAGAGDEPGVVAAYRLPEVK